MAKQPLSVMSPCGAAKYSGDALPRRRRRCGPVTAIGSERETPPAAAEA